MTLTATEAFVATDGNVWSNPYPVRRTTEFPEWYWKVAECDPYVPKYTDEWLAAELRKLAKRIPVKSDAGNSAT